MPSAPYTPSQVSGGSSVHSRHHRALLTLKQALTKAAQNTASSSPYALSHDSPHSASKVSVVSSSYLRPLGLSHTTEPLSLPATAFSLPRATSPHSPPSSVGTLEVYLGGAPLTRAFPTLQMVIGLPESISAATEETRLPEEDWPGSVAVKKLDKRLADLSITRMKRIGDYSDASSDQDGEEYTDEGENDAGFRKPRVVHYTSFTTGWGNTESLASTDKMDCASWAEEPSNTRRPQAFLDADAQHNLGLSRLSTISVMTESDDGSLVEVEERDLPHVDEVETAKLWEMVKAYNAACLSVAVERVGEDVVTGYELALA